MLGQEPATSPVCEPDIKKWELGQVRRLKCLYNHEMLINFTTQTPCQSYAEEVGKEQFRSYVEELAGTQVDALMCCPTAWRLPTYYSKVNPVWQTWAREHRDPNPVADWKYFDKVFHRVKNYMLRDDYEDPVQLTLDTSREIGVDFFLSYRMNDHHASYFNDKRISPTMDPFWIGHPEMRLHTGNGHYGLNYLREEVRGWYFAVVEELVNDYDLDGFELDFMRSPHFFPAEKTEEGAVLMTAFVKRIRQLLERTGKQRGKHLKLAVRVPWTVARCLNVGLDVPAWKSEGLVDMINVSPYFCTSPELEVETFEELPGSADIYGEMHFVTYNGGGGLLCNSNRRTTREIYETTAASLLERGADGISLFNFSYVRDHHFSEARRRPYMNPEPPFDALKHIVDLEYLKTGSMHYAITPGFGMLPAKVPAVKPLDFRIFLPCEPKGGAYRKALLRLEISHPGYLYGGLKTSIGDAALRQVTGSGELFAPFSNEALPHPECLFFFSVPLDRLKHGWNTITLEASMVDEYFALSLSDYQLKGVELALYKTDGGTPDDES